MTFLKSNWILLTAMAAAGVASLYLYIFFTGYLPEDNRPVIYGLIVLFNYSAGAMSIGLIMVFMLIGFMWIPEAAKRLPGWRLNAFAAGIALAAAMVACLSSLPTGGVKYVHVGDAQLQGKLYHLGAKLSIPPAESFYVLCSCDASGQFCQCHLLPDAGAIELSENHPQLIADEARGTLAIHLGDEVIYETKP